MGGGRIWLALAAVSGLMSVAAGAFGAHAAHDLAARELFRTGAAYQLGHALAAAVAILAGERVGRTGGLAAPLFLGGTILFSGSLYALALGAPRAIGAVTPVGGLLFMAGWAMLAWAAVRGDANGKHPPP
jgi:uncharacterized membrane protein YgdD (TMEM256/DUF423 family)